MVENNWVRVNGNTLTSEVSGTQIKITIHETLLQWWEEAYKEERMKTRGYTL